MSTKIAAANIRLKRAYEPPTPADGAWILIDRLWPRGERKAAAIDSWIKEIAPSTQLRKWFGHDPARWREFSRRYAAVLRGKAEDIGDAEGGIIGGLVYVGATAAAGAAAASGGTLLAAIAGAALAGGAGGLIGSVLAKWVGDHHAYHLQEQIERGGLQLWGRTRNPAREQRAIEILGKYSAEKIHIHGLPLHAKVA